MSVHTAREGSTLHVENARVSLEVDVATLRASFFSRAGASLAGFRPRARVEGENALAHGAHGEQREEIEGPHGACTRLTLTCQSDPGLELSLALELGADWPGVILELSVTNRGQTARAIDALDPIWWSRAADADLHLPGPPDALRFFRMGYQSWSPSGFPRLTDRDPLPRLKLLRTMHYGAFTPPCPAGEHVSDFATTLRCPGEAGLSVGFLTHREFLNHVALRHVGARLDELAARVSCEGHLLAPGATLRAERLWLGAETPGEDGLAAWAARAGREMEAPLLDSAGSAWCSWYQFFTRVRAEDVRAATRTLAALQAPVDTIQIDDGFQAAVGDWLEYADGFPDGVAPLAREIRDSGFRAGLWLAPFLVSRESRTAERHPDWILRSPRGTPRVAVVNDGWKGRIAWALDPTHPGVLEWLFELGRAVRGQGFDYLKLDFLYAGALAGARHDPAVPLAAGYRRALRALRDGAGDGVLLLGCGAPLVPSIGLVEAMRIGPDVAPFWRARSANRALGILSAPAAENSLRNVLARAPLHRRLWHNDPDCVLLRDRDTKLGEREVRTLAGAIACSGGLIVVSDDLSKLGPERRALLQRLLPSLPGTPELGPVATETPETLLLRGDDGGGLLFAVNLGRSARVLEVDLAALGFAGTVSVYDVWGDQLLGPARGRLRTARLQPRASTLLRLVPEDGLPRVLGSTLHLGGGALEGRSLAALGNDGQRAVSLTLHLPGLRQGRLRLRLAGGEPLTLSLCFRDRSTLEIGGGQLGVEESGGMPDR